jgi:hypothetical protein
MNTDTPHILYIIDDIEIHDQMAQKLEQRYPGVEIRIVTWTQIHLEFPVLESPSSPALP